MKDYKFNPTPAMPGNAISYDPIRIGGMSFEEFKKSGEASLLFHGSADATDDMKGPLLEAWHQEAKRVAAEMNPPAKNEDANKKK